MLDWLIIGGGIHGTALSLYLTRRKKISPDAVRVLDPHPQPLAQWAHFTANTGMAYLRSPLPHHIHYDPWSLRTFVETQRGKPFADFLPPFQRPSLKLFSTYSQWLIQHYQLDKRRLQGRATGLKRLHHCWQIETSAGSIEAKNVVLAIGAGEHPHWPEWSKPLHATNAPIHHLFQPDFVRSTVQTWNHAVVIGGGISAAQAALTLGTQQPGTVTMLSRHGMRVHHFDSDPCWVTRLCLLEFHDEPDFNQRRLMIRQARYTGSIPSDVDMQLLEAIGQQTIKLTFGEVEKASHHGDDIQLTLTNGDTLTSDYVILATGFEKSRPGGSWIDTLISDHDLPVANDGYPIVDKTLRWDTGLFVMGPLAELEVGPVARNIIGGRLACERISQVI